MQWELCENNPDIFKQRVNCNVNNTCKHRWKPRWIVYSKCHYYFTECMHWGEWCSQCVCDQGNELSLLHDMKQHFLWKGFKFNKSKRVKGILRCQCVCVGVQERVRGCKQVQVWSNLNWKEVEPILHTKQRNLLMPICLSFSLHPFFKGGRESETTDFIRSNSLRCTVQSRLKQEKSIEYHLER